MGERYFSLGLNLFVYAAGKQDFHNRLDNIYVAPTSIQPVQQVTIARLQYAGAMRGTQSHAWTRFCQYFPARRTGLRVGRLTPTVISDLRPGDDAAGSILTGVYDYTFTSSGRRIRSQLRCWRRHALLIDGVRRPGRV